MVTSISLTRRVPAKTDLRARFVTKEAAKATADGAGASGDAALLAARGFDGSAGQVELVPDPSGAPLALVGLGPEAEVAATTFRKAGTSLARAARRSAKLVVEGLDDAPLPEGVEPPARLQALAEGILLGAYGYLALKSAPTPTKLTSVVVVATGSGLTAALNRAVVVAAAVNRTRDLVNEPGGSLTPSRFAEHARTLAKDRPLRVTVWDLPSIKRNRLGGLAGVNRGSQQQPRFVRVEYRPSGKVAGHLALVGKGITFDSGGLSIKTAAGMMTMKCDMGGAGAVLGAMTAIAELAPPVRVSAYMPLTDNMPGPDATRPGDVLTIRNGKTVEVLNTDAEGRLVLADALSVAAEAKPDAIIDLATLTGACIAALGSSIAGLLGNNAAWTEQVRAVADRVGERVWPLPLPPEYRSQLDSPVADLKNIGGSNGGALLAGLFLAEFVPSTIPWAHLDMAGPAFAEAENPDHPRGGTGFGVRLLVELACSFTPPPPPASAG